ncbi:MAG: SDR family oxidoreductase [Myxococcales bacterium]|nr:SDR family oxidoreductase [Myxococcales bacterium]
MRVAITGISGRFGALLTRRLHRQHTVVGIDRRPFPGAPADVELHRIDIRRKRCEEVFRKGAFDAVVHLNVMHDPRASSADHHTFNIQGTTRVMQYCQRHGIKKLILLSSANVYGPRADNTQFLTEDAPLMGGERFHQIQDLIGIDMLGQSFFWKHPEVETVILRPVHIVGAVRNAPSNYLRLDRPWTLAGFDPMVQLIHEDDVAMGIERALRPGAQGIFNLAGCEPAPLSRIIELAGGRPLPIPHFAAGPMLERLWKMRLTTFPAPELDHLRYVCMVDAARAREVLGYTPRYDLDATLTHLRLTRALLAS